MIKDASQPRMTRSNTMNTMNAESMRTRTNECICSRDNQTRIAVDFLQQILTRKRKPQRLLQTPFVVSVPLADFRTAKRLHAWSEAECRMTRTRQYNHGDATSTIQGRDGFGTGWEKGFLESSDSCLNEVGATRSFI